jgi:hypothetical protein
MSFLAGCGGSGGGGGDTGGEMTAAWPIGGTTIVDLHAGLTLLLQLGNDPSQAKRIATFSKI